MKRFTQGLVLFAGLLAVPSSKDSDVAFAEMLHYEADPRLNAIRSFFASNDAPAAELASDFIAAADNYGLDWRLLPSIAFVESGGGKECVNNNILGWANGRRAFRSLSAGIHYVGYQLTNSPLYRGKDISGILRTYNPRPEYARLVESVMATLGPDAFSEAFQ